MTKYFVTIAAVAMFSTVAYATEDFDNTAFTLAVEGTDYGIELSVNETDRSIEVHTNNQPLAQYAVGMTDNDSVRNWRISATPRLAHDISGVTLYVEPLLGLNWGDSHNKTQFEITPTIGAAYNGLNNFTPYAELTGKNVAEVGDILDIEQNEKTATVGGIMPLTEVVDLNLMMIQTMDSEWDNANRQIEAVFSINF